jgi:hypothetical protein
VNRRDFIRNAGVGAVGTVLLGRTGPSEASSATGLKNEGVGMYTDASVANQLSTFTINRTMVSCGVGTPGADASTPAFAMVMYSTRIASYSVDRAGRQIRATGRMRSITRVDGDTVEDVEHDFLAVAVDRGTAGPDRFDVHFTTPFWNPTNPMCTPSDEVEGWCRFGGEVLPTDDGLQMGDVVVGP